MFFFQAKYKEASRKEASSCLYHQLPETLETLHAKEATELQSQVHKHLHAEDRLVNRAQKDEHLQACWFFVDLQMWEFPKQSRTFFWIIRGPGLQMFCSLGSLDWMKTLSYSLWTTNSLFITCEDRIQSASHGVSRVSDFDLSCPSLSFPVLSDPLLCFLVLSFPYLYFRFLSCPVLPCPYLYCTFLSCPFLSFTFLSFPFLFFPFLSFLFLSCPVLSCLPSPDEVQGSR